MARLQRIVARIRPRIDQLLGRGVRAKVLRLVLRGLRAWYRLTALTAPGGSGAAIARLNPELPASERAKLAKQLELQERWRTFVRQREADRQRQRPAGPAPTAQQQTGASQAAAPGGQAAAEAPRRTQFTLDPSVGLEPQAEALSAQISAARRNRGGGVDMAYGATGRALSWNRGYPSDPGGRLVNPSGGGRYQDKNLMFQSLDRALDFLEGLDAVQRGDLAGALASGHSLDDLLFAAILRTNIEAERDPIMRTLGPAETRWARQARTEQDARRRLREVFSAGLMTHNRSVGVASRTREAGQLVVPGGRLDVTRMTDPSVERLLRDPTPSVLSAVQRQERNWAARVGIHPPSEDEARRSVETARSRLNRLTLWGRRVLTEDTYFEEARYQQQIERLRRIVDEIYDMDPDIDSNVPRLYTPRRLP